MWRGKKRTKKPAISDIPIHIRWFLKKVWSPG